MTKIKDILLEFLGWVLLIAFLLLMVFAFIKSRNDYKDYLLEYENSQDEITYKVYEYKELTNHKGFTIYEIVIDGETYYTNTVEYKIGGGDGFYFVMTKRKKSNYFESLFFGIDNGSGNIYNYKLLVVY